MEAYTKQFNFLKENIIHTASTATLWQWTFVALVVYKIWRYRQQYIPIPTYGGILSFSRLLTIIRMSRLGPKAFSRIYSEYPMILLPRLEYWIVFVQPQFVDELLKTPDEDLSFRDATLDNLQVQYTMGKRFTETHDHHTAIKHHLTRHLPALFPEVLEEIRLTLDEKLQTQSDEWKKVHVLPWIFQTVARASNRIFVGAPLCRDQKWLDFNINSAAAIAGTAIILNFFPRWMLPILGPIIGPANRRLRESVKMVGPLIEERLSMHPSGWPDDFITWVLINTPESDRTVDEIALKLLSVNFAAVHTSSLNMGHVLYWLLARPKYVMPLREEIEETIGRFGWTKDAIGHMPRLDSFMKESMRMSPLGALVLQRKVLKPFTFSNGVTLPTGTYLAAHLRAVHHDGSLYEDPEEFDGFRFFDEKPNSSVDVEKVVHEPRQPMYTTSKTYLPFSHGRHACPGRFFASMELKLLMAYLLVNYDMKWPEEDIPSNLGSTEEGYRPPDRWFNFNCLPNQNAHMMVRKRV